MYQRFVDTAHRMIKKYGREVLIQRRIADIEDFSKFNPIKGYYLDNDKAEYSIHMLSVSINEEWANEYPVQVGDKLVLMEAKSGVVPKMNDEIDGYKVVQVKPIEPADVAILFKVQLRKG